MLWIVVKAETHTWFKGSVINASHTHSAAARLRDHGRKIVRVRDLGEPERNRVFWKQQDSCTY